MFDRTKLLHGNVIKGPAIIEEVASTTVVEPGDTVTVNAYGHLVMKLGGRNERFRRLERFERLERLERNCSSRFQIVQAVPNVQAVIDEPGDHSDESASMPSPLKSSGAPWWRSPAR